MRLIAENLVKEYGSRRVVDGVSFTLEPGEVLGVLGPNGAGKSTTVCMLYGSVLPTSGRVTVGPFDVMRQGRDARACLGIVGQQDDLDDDQPVESALRFYAHHHRIVGKAASDRIDVVLERLNLTECRRAVIRTLSGGLKRRLVLARALMHDPRIVFLDEPTTGLDPDARQAFWRMIDELRGEGRSVLLTTHYMDEAERLSNRLLLLQQGKIVDQGLPRDLIDRWAGGYVLEVEGLEHPRLLEVARVHGGRCMPFGSGFVVTGLDGNSKPINLDRIHSELEFTQPRRLTRRKANLEDVFLVLTGSALS